MSTIDKLREAARVYAEAGAGHNNLPPLCVGEIKLFADGQKNGDISIRMEVDGREVDFSQSDLETFTSIMMGLSDAVFGMRQPIKAVA